MPSEMCNFSEFRLKFSFFRTKVKIGSESFFWLSEILPALRAKFLRARRSSQSFFLALRAEILGAHRGSQSETLRAIPLRSPTGTLLVKGTRSLSKLF